jgi:hypothetical protein
MGHVIVSAIHANLYKYSAIAIFQGGLTSGKRPVVKIVAESLSQHDEKHVVPTPLSGILGRKKKKKNM